MRKKIFVPVLAFAVFFSVAGSANAANFAINFQPNFNPDSIRNQIEARLAAQKQAMQDRFCAQINTIRQRVPTFPLPAYCTPTPPPPPAPPAPTLDFSALPNPVEVGQNSTLTWSSTDAVYCEASGGWSGQKNLSGNEVVTISATTTYALACGNVTATTTKSVEVDAVIPPPPPEPTLDFSATPETIMLGATSTLNWSSDNTNTCAASGGWSGSEALAGSLDVSPNATTTYSLQCDGDGGSISKDATVNVVIPPPVEEPPVQTIGHVVISEVYYDVSSTTGEEDPGNEWLELYNGSNDAADMSGWTIFDGNATDTIPTLSPIPSGSFVLITDKASTTNFWTIPAEVPVVILGSPIGNGLSNGGDALFLKNGDSVVDEVNWGTNTTVMDPSVAGASDGNSIARKNLATDTDTADDWQTLAVPTPGSF